MKICIRCQEEKDIESYSRDCTLPSGRKARCKECIKKTRKRNTEKERKYRRTETYRAIRRRYESSEQGKKARNLYRRTSEIAIQSRRNYRKSVKHQEWLKEYLKRPNVIARESLRNRLRSAIKGNYKKGMGLDNLGCTIPQFKEHLESLFKSGMSWNNHGDWHIDHIIPLSYFDLSDEEQVKIACNYKNMQPLWRHENLSKGNKYEVSNRGDDTNDDLW